MFLKLAVLNNSGNVGKSMICDVLLKPRIPNCEVIKIETINSDGTDDSKMSAKEIDDIFEKINDHDVCLLDIGASNIELFIQNMKKLDGAIEDIDYFFIPTTTSAKQQQDTNSTILTLIGMGVDPNYIKVIFNYYDPEITIERQYPVIFTSETCEMLELVNIDNQFTIEESQVFEFLSRTGLSFGEIVNDDREFKQLIRQTKDKEQRALLSLEQMTQRFAKGFDKKLNDTFDKIKKACNFDLDDSI